jgi:hypothetical protein
MREKILFKTLVGSRAYGTDIETSDFDYKGVYCQSNDDILCFRYKEQIDVNKDEVFYEVRRFLQLLQSANPTVLEMLFVDKESIIQSSPEFELIRKHRKKFLTKKCCMSFGGYAIAQIKKAKGLNKKMNWEKTRVERKTPLDFVYVCIGETTMPITEWLLRTARVQENCGLVALNHFRDCYALFYDNETRVEPLKYKGIITPDSNELRLSSIPKGEQALVTISYNKDGYSSHCKDYNQYQTWLKNRNEQRYIDLKGHNQKIDGKNLLHCRRLLDMAIEIATDKNISVRRPNADYLLKIRRGEVLLDEIIETAEKDIERLEELYDNSDLPKSVDMDFLNELLLEIRHMKK